MTTKFQCDGQVREHKWLETTASDYVTTGRTYKCKRCPETTSVSRWNWDEPPQVSWERLAETIAKLS